MSEYDCRYSSRFAQSACTCHLSSIEGRVHGRLLLQRHAHKKSRRTAAKSAPRNMSGSLTATPRCLFDAASISGSRDAQAHAQSFVRAVLFRQARPLQSLRPAFCTADGACGFPPSPGPARRVPAP
jgi:hypothetical protein